MNIINRIGGFLRSKNSEYDIACLKIAFEELSLSRELLSEEFGNKITIIGERRAQKKYNLV